MRELDYMTRKIGHQNLQEHRTSLSLALKVILKRFWRHMKCNTLLLKSYVCIGITNCKALQNKIHSGLLTC